MEDNPILISAKPNGPPPPAGDLDDWIFRGEGWLASDR